LIGTHAPKSLTVVHHFKATSSNAAGRTLAL